MKISELCRRANVMKDTVRFYERRDLLPPAARLSITNSYKDYCDETLQRLRRIRYAKGLGFRLDEIPLMLGATLAPGSGR